jgi:hypothetical protein
MIAGSVSAMIHQEQLRREPNVTQSLAAPRSPPHVRLLIGLSFSCRRSNGARLCF